MLTRINQTLGASLAPIGAMLGWISGWFMPLLRALVGVWQAPAWLRWIGRGASALAHWCRWHGAQVLLLAVVGGVLWTQAPLLKRWWQGLIPDRAAQLELTFKVSEPGRTQIEDQLPPNPLVIVFSGQAAPLVKVGKPATDIQMDPSAAGQWTWAAADKLVFQPKDDWPVGQRYEVKWGRKALASNVHLPDDHFQFGSPAFKVSVGSGEFYQDPVQVNLRRVVYQVQFSHPVNAQKFESSLRLDEGDPGAT
ncbi:MAG: alpha-2-macroglobulin family protein, partial [Pseudomonadota bacterium]